MKNTKKLLALGLATTMLFSLAACGNESNNESSGGASDSGSSSAEESSSEESSAEESSEDSGSDESSDGGSEYDFGGTTVKFFQLGPENDTEDPLQIQARDYVEQKYNIKWERVQLDGYDGLNQTELFVAAEASGAPAAHVVSCNPDCFYSMMAAGLLHDFTDTYKNWGMNSFATDADTWRGHVYGYSGDRWTGEGLIYNREELAGYGMDKMPTDLFMEGKWDYESCRAYLAELQSKLPDGKYAIGTYPYHWGRIAANANGVVLVDNDGTINLANDAVIEAVEFYQSLIEDGIAYPISVTTDADGNTSTDVAYAGDDERIAITYGNAGNSAKPSFCPFPWSSNYVTCDGDYTTISDNYCGGYCYWGLVTVTESAEKDCGIPADVLMQMYIDYEMEMNGGEENKENWSPMTTQEDGHYRNPEAGTTRSFVNEDDILVYDWLSSRKRADFSYFAADAGVEVWTAFRDCLRDRLDARSTLESYQSAGEQGLKDAGLMD